MLSVVHVSIFDALNGIDRRFRPVHFDLRAPRHASRRAAVVGAAYTALVNLFPTQVVALTADRDASLAAIADDERSESIQRGLNWGEQVANVIVAWSNTDGLNPPAPPYLGHPDVVGKWRPTPPGFAAGLTPTMAIMRPFVIPSPSSFRPLGPPSLTSREYADSVNEVKKVGKSGVIPDRTDDQTLSARFWAGAAASVWNRLAASASRRRHLTLSENARLFALFNMTLTDALIACWDSKYVFEFWRPITAIQLADTDGNSDTEPDTTWAPLITNPPYPEYYSGHHSISGAAEEFLTAVFGKRMQVESYSEAAGIPAGYIRSWRNFEAAADDAFMARIWAGIHFRFAMEDTRKVSEKIARYVLKHGIHPRHDHHEDRDDKHEDKDKHEGKDKH